MYCHIVTSVHVEYECQLELTKCNASCIRNTKLETAENTRYKIILQNVKRLIKVKTQGKSKSSRLTLAFRRVFPSGKI